MTETKEYFNSLFSYDKETGFLYWKRRTEDTRSAKFFNSRFSGKKVGSKVKSNKSRTPYLYTQISGKSYAVHRIIFAMHYGYFPEQIDHIDHDGLNNRIENLRASNSKDNARNLPMQKSNKSGCIGVNWHKSAKKWQARAVDLEGKRVDLGRYDNIEDAVSARRRYEKEFGYYEYRDNI